MESQIVIEEKYALGESASHLQLLLINPAAVNQKSSCWENRHASLVLGEVARGKGMRKECSTLLP